MRAEKGKLFCMMEIDCASPSQHADAGQYFQQFLQIIPMIKAKGIVLLT